MSASTRSVCLFRNISRFSISPLYFPCHKISRYHSTVAVSSEYNEEAEYPPIKPKYPPGEWGKLDPKVAWEWHEKGQNMLSLPDPRERLETFAGQDDITMWHLRIFDFPRNTSYKQSVTKTYTIKGMPELIQNKNVEVELHALRSILLDSLAQPNPQCNKKKSIKYPMINNNMHKTLSNVLMSLMTSLSSEHTYLRRAQIDENVQVTSFWYRDGGFAEKVIKNKKINDWFLKFEGQHEADFQIRTESPLSEFVPLSADLCKSVEIPDLTGDHPEIHKTRQHFTRPLSLSGYRVGDPCEFTQLGVYMPTQNCYTNLERWGEKYMPEIMSATGMITSFISCLSQAYNQGFGIYHELTYPITTQTIVTDGKDFQFFCYQLNTIQLWKDKEANPLCNIMWSTDIMPLYEQIENDQVKGLNEETFKLLLKFLLNAPVDRGVELKPYLPEWNPPRDKKLFINYKGEEPLEHPVVGRFQYPRHALYF